MEFKHAYSQSHRASDLVCKDPSLAQQSFKDDVDINVLLERFKVTGQLPQGVRMPTYGDFTGVSDYRSALDAINRAKDAFMQLPANVRSRFENDPQQFVDFCSNPANLEEARKLGLAPDLAKPDAKPTGGIPDSPNP